MHSSTVRLPYTDALPLYRGLKSASPSCLFESASAVDKSSRMSVIGFEPPLELTGKDEHLVLRLLHPRGIVFYDFVKTEFASFIESEKDGRLVLNIPKSSFQGPEDERLERQNIAQPLRRILARFKTGDKNFMGLYGAFGYRFVYLFEDIPCEKPCPEPDFHLFLFDNILLFNHLTQDLTLYVTRENEVLAETDLEQLKRQMATNNQRPTTNNQQPATNNQQPTTNNQQPTTSNQHPATSNQQPATSNQQPTTNNQQPATSNPISVNSSKPPTMKLSKNRSGAAFNSATKANCWKSS
jgi:anthranilate/para-aminobenzoate synthase component I